MYVFAQTLCHVLCYQGLEYAVSPTDGCSAYDGKGAVLEI